MMSGSGHEPVQPMHPQIASTSDIPSSVTNNLDRPRGSHNDATAVPKKRKRGQDIPSPATSTLNQSPGPGGSHEDLDLPVDSDAEAVPKKGPKVTFTDPWTGETKRSLVLKPTDKLTPE